MIPQFDSFLLSLNDNRCLLIFSSLGKCFFPPSPPPSDKRSSRSFTEYLTEHINLPNFFQVILLRLVFTDITQPRILISLLARGKSKSSRSKSSESVNNMPVLSIPVFSPFEKVDLPWLVWLSGLSAGLTKPGVSDQVHSRGLVRGTHTLMFLSLSFSLPTPL